MTGDDPAGPRPGGTGDHIPSQTADAAPAGTVRWRTARHAQVLSLDYARRDPAGRLTGVYTPVPITHPPAWCGHLDTICVDCLPGWSEDHLVTVFRHGAQGAAAGCRCPTCRLTLPPPATGSDPEPRPDRGPR